MEKDEFGKLGSDQVIVGLGQCFPNALVSGTLYTLKS